MMRIVEKDGQLRIAIRDKVRFYIIRLKDNSSKFVNIIIENFSMCFISNYHKMFCVMYVTPPYTVADYGTRGAPNCLI